LILIWKNLKNIFVDSLTVDIKRKKRQVYPLPPNSYIKRDSAKD